jgi:hypothetical protein
MTQLASNIDRQGKQPDMLLISSRAIAFLDSQSLALRQAREALFRTTGGRFVLYLADGDPSSADEERLVFLELREALLWLNEPSEQRGSFWT